jgi:serine/threonine protein kinase/tetratricopeptide (TPR) repeat protein
MKGKDTRTCLVCGAKFPATKEFCPVCILCEALGEQVKPTESSLEERRPDSTSRRRLHRFEHYELVTDNDGNPVELGRGAMGITYKAFDVDLQCPVTLKVINEKYLGDEPARLRFLREARAAASVRHPNVASVLHLGRTESSYFYAMEFVDGETLEHLIKRSGRLEVKLALEIVSQVTAGLAAVHKQKLVHRDIKPSNIMVSLENGCAVTVKIIDLGLAKAVNERGAQTAISTPGGFAGTPEYASPEQFAGVAVDIRSDLYSLGVMLWEMVTGQLPVFGSSPELIYRHQHAALPLEQLKDIPQPVIVLLEALLEKNPGRRFQDPVELLQAMPTITAAVDARRRIALQNLQNKLPADRSGVTRKPTGRRGPDKISVARLPITGSDLFGREDDISFLDHVWAGHHINLVTIVAWAGVGKSTLINHWLGRMAAKHYRSAELVFGWSFYRQGTGGGTASANEFIDSALAWFGDPDPRIGTAWEKGERLAKLISHRRTLLILDGLEPQQNPPGPQEGRVRDPSLQVLLRELAAFNTGLCVITTRLPVADVADHEGTSVLRRHLEQLCGDDGAKLLRALGVKGYEAELRSASDEFGGHCLALTLLGSYLADAYNGDIRRRKEVSERLAHDVRQGFHARKAMESYQSWFGEGPELSVLRMLGLFDRPADEKALEAILTPPAIQGLTESLVDLSPAEWRTILARLRRAKLLAREDPHHPGQLDTHPLVREYFGEQLKSLRTDAWKECNLRLYQYYRSVAPPLPETFTEMEPLFLAVICGCNAGLYRGALREVYIPRIQRGDSSFAANVLGARAALLSALVHFFEHGRWGSPVQAGDEGQGLTAEDQLFILLQAAVNITAMREAAPEAKLCYERAEALCHSLNRPRLLYLTLMGQGRYSRITGDLSAAFEIDKRVYALAQEQNEPALMIGANCTLAATLYYLGDFEAARQYAMRGVQLWRSESEPSAFEEVDSQPVACLAHLALTEWQFGEIVSSRATMAEAISLAKKLNDMHGLAVVLSYAAILGYCESNPAEVEYLASTLIELSTRHNFEHWLAIGAVCRGWARSASGDTAQGLACIEKGMEDYRATGSIAWVPYFLALKAEALHLAGRTSEALEAIREAETVAERIQLRWCNAELHRLRGVFLAAVAADETQIEASFGEAINTAKQQKSVSLEERAKASYAEYRQGKGGR